MRSDDALGYAVQWADAWNNRDVEQVLGLFHEDVEFTSPTANQVVAAEVFHGIAS